MIREEATLYKLENAVKQVEGLGPARKVRVWSPTLNRMFYTVNEWDGDVFPYVEICPYGNCNLDLYFVIKGELREKVLQKGDFYGKVPYIISEDALYLREGILTLESEDKKGVYEGDLLDENGNVAGNVFENKTYSVKYTNVAWSSQELFSVCKWNTEG